MATPRDPMTTPETAAASARRAEFLRVAAKGRRAAMPGLVLQALQRDDDAPARLGFTVTKKVGNAVIRNRTRRRLKEAARLLLRERPLTGVDLVLVGRDATRARDFAACGRTWSERWPRRACDDAGGPCRGRRRARLSMDHPPGDRRQLPLLAKLQRLRDRGVPHPWRATRQRAGGAPHPALQPVVRQRL